MEMNKMNQLKKKAKGSNMNVEAFLDEKNMLRLSVGIPDQDGDMEAPPMDIVCIVDISYSMGGSAACQTDGKTEYEDLGYSLMDLVNHAVKTVVKVMRPQDRLAIILFDDKIRVPYEFTQLNEKAREEILSFVGGIKKSGATNIYDALVKGIELIQNRPANEKNEAAILFFTDGQPNSGKFSDPKGIVENIEKLKVQNKFRYPLHTFAFGQYTACTSSLMFDIAKVFDGMFGYIQDAKTLGTIFINGIAYTLCNAATSVLLQVELEKGNGESDGQTQYLELTPTYQEFHKNGLIKLPGLRYGQTTDILFNLKQIMTKKNKKKELAISDKAKLKVTVSRVSKGKLLFPEIKEIEMKKCQSSENLDHQLRFETIDLFSQILQKFKDIQDIHTLQDQTKQFVEKLQKIDNESEFVTGLIDTVDRQTVQMLEKKKYVEKWGEHQLRHLIRSLEMQIKGNFREQVLKDFGGQLFNDLADTADDVYNSMDPPTASLAAQQAQNAAQVKSAADFAAKMNTFDDDDGGYYGGGCFAGTNTIKMADGSYKQVKNLVKGDKIASSKGQQATINCVIKTSTNRGMADMCQLEGGLLITPGHPVKLQNQWVYPKNIAQRKMINCDSFYNLVVDQGHTAIVNGVELILLGHGFTNGILKHAYLGTQRVIDDLKLMPGFNQGLIHLQQGSNGKMKKQNIRADNQIAKLVQQSNQ